jgi:8-oxo-dGTP pyrophosphatase MutT (NUDIX family)
MTTNNEMNKVFINDRPLHFTDNLELEMVKKTIEYESSETLLKAIRVLENDFVQSLYLFHPNLFELKKEFKSLFTYIEAAGGIVKNSKGNILFIFRAGKWDLPKGKIEEDEDIEAAAVREVQEECGLKELEIIKELPSTYHTYEAHDKKYLKRTYWFEMLYTGKAKPVPQKEENITQATWLDQKKLLKALSNTYNSIRDVMKNLS